MILFYNYGTLEVLVHVPLSINLSYFISNKYCNLGSLHIPFPVYSYLQNIIIQCSLKWHGRSAHPSISGQDIKIPNRRNSSLLGRVYLRPGHAAERTLDSGS